MTKTNYEYTEVNRLDQPHKYMYTPYLGVEFMNAYFKDRLKNIKRFQSKDNQSYKNKIDSYFYFGSKRQLDSVLNNAFSQANESWQSSVNWQDLSTSQEVAFASIKDEIKTILLFNVEEEIDTEELLSSLIFSQLNVENEKLTKEWLDRLVQRFEVTKKLYETYPAYFRKGKGATDRMHLYWLFSLSLTLFYASTKSIKYLSTLLKVSDLLCSLNNDILKDEVPLRGLSLILSVEVLSIKLLLLNNLKEVDFVFE